MSEYNKFDVNKVIFLGKGGVGKTNLIRISTGQNFDSSLFSTTYVSSVEKIFKYGKKRIIFNLWDTIGQEKYKAITRLFFKNSKIVIYVYDITNRDSFEQIEYWIKEVENEIGNDYIMAIVGNKNDLYTEEQVTEEEGQKYAKMKKCKFKLTSAKNDPLGFIQFLESLFVDYLNKIEGNYITQNQSKNITINSGDNKKKQANCC